MNTAGSPKVECCVPAILPGYGIKQKRKRTFRISTTTTATTATTTPSTTPNPPPPTTTTTTTRWTSVDRPWLSLSSQPCHPSLPASSLWGPGCPPPVARQCSSLSSDSPFAILRFPQNHIANKFIFTPPAVTTEPKTPLGQERFRPEWCIPTIYLARDTPFWSGTLDLILHRITYQDKTYFGMHLAR